MPDAATITARNSPEHRSRLFRDLSREHGFEPLRVEGALPRELAGTLFRTGPALFGSFGRRYDHLFEGDGGVCAVRFREGRAEGSHRVVQSAGLEEERAAGRPLYGSVASRPRRIANMLQQRIKNIANTNVIAWQGRLFALVELSRPMELSPDTLATLGESDLEGVIGTSFSAHPHHVAARRALYNFGVRFGRKPAIDLYELPMEGRARKLGSLPIESPTLVHDFAATTKHLVFFLGPARLQMLRVLLGEPRPDRLFTWEPGRGTEVVIVPIDDPTHPVRFHVDSFFQWHFANAFEQGESVIVDFVRHRDLSAMTTMRDEATLRGTVIDMNGGQLCRATLDRRARRMRTEPAWDARMCEFPVVDTRGAGSVRRHVWLTTAAPGRTAIARVDLERADAAIWTPPHGHHISEPIFAPRPGHLGELDGWTLVLVYDEHTETSHVAVLDAAAPDQGPIARAHFNHHVPVTLHGTWVA